MRSPYAPSNRPLTQMDELLCIRGVTPELVYGADTNRNGTIDGGEDALLDGLKPVAALGWAGIIRSNQPASSTQDGDRLSDVDRALFAFGSATP